MSDSEAECEAVFSRLQWSKVARSISLDKLSPDMMQEICNSLFAYAIDCIPDHPDEDDGPIPEGERKRRKKRHKVAQDARDYEILEQFAGMARAFRLTLYRFQKSLRPFEPAMDRAEQLGSEVYELQRHAERKLETCPKSKGGRPLKRSRDALIFRLVRIYTQLTGKRPHLNKIRDPKNPDRLRPSGSLYDFVFSVLDIAGIPTRGIEHVIQSAAREAKTNEGK